MFPAPTAPGFASPPRRGFGARVAGGFSRFATALCSAVTGGLLRSQAGRNVAASTDADGPAAARPRPPRKPRRARTGILARLTGHRSAPAAGPQQAGELSDAELIDATFPGLRPEVRAFFDTPLDECDPEMLGVVLEALAELIAGVMTPREGMRDAQDVFHTLSSRLGVMLETGETQAGALPEAAAAPAPDAAAMQAEAGSPGLPVPAQGPTAAASNWTPLMQHAEAPATAAPGQPETAPVAARPVGGVVGGADTQSSPMPNCCGSPPWHMWHRSRRTGPGSIARDQSLHNCNIWHRGRFRLRAPARPPRLLWYAARAGPPHGPGAPQQARRVALHARGHRLVASPS